MVKFEIRAEKPDDLWMLTFYTYKDKADEWRWRLEAANHKIIADSGEGYKNRADMIKAINLIKTAPIKMQEVSPAARRP